MFKNTTWHAIFEFYIVSDTLKVQMLDENKNNIYSFYGFYNFSVFLFSNINYILYWWLSLIHTHKINMYKHTLTRKIKYFVTVYYIKQMQLKK